MNKIHYAKPSITELEVNYATDAAANGWGERCYEYIYKFEDIFSKYIGSEHAMATSSCTGAMHMGLSALGIGQGDEVILADINWIATVAPIAHLGATPVFVDILSDTWCIDPDKTELAITSKTKAIIATHLYGNLCDMDKLLEIGKRNGIPIIEDSAEALGSCYDGKRAGSMGLFSTFSFHGTKTITTGEGGMFVTNNSELYDKVQTLNNHGRSKTQSKQFWSDVIGFKYKMSNIQAAIGCAQMERIEEILKNKRRVFEYYYSGLSDCPLKMNPEHANTVNSYWMPTIIVDKSVKFQRNEMLDAFGSNSIDGRVFFWPLSMFPMFNEVKSNTVSYGLYERGMNLPSYTDLSEEDMDRCIDIVRSLVRDK